MKRALHYLAVIAAYLATAGLVHWVAVGAASPVLVWPAAGVSLVALSLLGMRAWPAIFIASVIYGLMLGNRVPVVLIIAAGNTLEAVVALAILERLRFDRSMVRVRDAAALVASSLLSPLVAATIGVTTQWAFGVITTEAVRTAWGEWWLRGVLGTLLFAPIIWVWLEKSLTEVRSRLEWVTLLVVVCGTGYLVFFSQHAGDWQLPYLIYPGLIWAALRFRQRGAVTVLVLVSALAITGTLLHQGAFYEGNIESSLITLQGFLVVNSVTLLLMAAASSERDGAITVRDEFLSIASHELRTPLTSLKLHLEMLRRHTRAGADPAKIQEKVIDLEQQIDRLGGLVTELLDVSRAVSGRMKLELQPMDLGAAITSATQKLTAGAATAGCELKVSLQPCPGQYDPTRVEQVVGSLISNAIKFGPGKPIEVTLTVRSEQALIVVRDQGVGIAREDQTRIFERFERAVSTRHFGGLGLGLWLTRQVVEASGGTITVKSEPGHGAEFTVVLPRRTVPA